MDFYPILTILTVVAIVFAPLLAVQVSGYLDREREKRARKMDIFRTLMRTRDARLSPDHIGALNLIAIEFSDYPEVIERWKKLHTHFGAVHAKHSHEKSEPHLHGERLTKERFELLIQILSSMANVLKVEVEQIEILRGGYYPQSYVNMEMEQSIMRKYIVDLAYGTRNVPVKIINLPNDSDSTDPKNP